MTADAIDKIISMQNDINNFHSYLRKRELVVDYFKWLEDQEVSMNMQIPKKYQKE